MRKKRLAIVQIKFYKLAFFSVFLGMIVETEAVVLQVRKFGDTSKIAVLYTKEMGKISIIAKGAFTSKSRFGAALEPLSYVHLSFYQKNTDSLHLLKTIEIAEPFNRIAKNYDTVIAGFTVLEFLSSVQADNHSNYDVFNTLIIYLKQLNYDANSFSTSTIFLFRLADAIGYRIDFNFITSIYNNELEKIKISLENAQPVLIAKNANYHQLSVELLKKINFLLHNSNIMLTSNEFKEIAIFFRIFFSFHLDKKITIKSIDLLL